MKTVTLIATVDNPVSICDSCLRSGDDDYYEDGPYYDGDDDYDDSMDGDHESGLASAGFGTDEDYGGYDSYDFHDAGFDF